MNCDTPKAVELTDRETELYSQIPEKPQNEGWQVIANAIEELVESLLDRKAVPEVRLRLFCDPEFAETGKKSRQQIFESNGITGSEIFRHPHFLPYLHHFIRGPRLPDDVIENLCTILNDDHGTSGMVLDQYRKHARASVRQHGLPRSEAATEFFRLGVELGMDLHAARSLRDAAQSAR